MSSRKYGAVAETLRRQLSEGRWQTGERLPTERALAEKLDGPRSTVREALIVLEVDGEILSAVGGRDSDGARAARWRNLGNVSKTLLLLTDPQANVTILRKMRVISGTRS